MQIQHFHADASFKLCIYFLNILRSLKNDDIVFIRNDYLNINKKGYFKTTSPILF